MSIDQKIPFAQSLINFNNRQFESNTQALGRAWPCYVTAVSGSIVTVKFDIESGDTITLPEVTIPVFGPEYIRYPIQIGDKGFTVPADLSLRAISDLGVGKPDFSDPGNLTALVFLPMGSTKWSEVDGNALVMYGPNGCVIRDSGSGCVITLTPTSVTTTVGSTIITVIGNKVTITSPDVEINGNLTVHGVITGDEGLNISGGTTTAQITGNVDIIGTLTNNGKLVGSTHTHPDAQGGNTGAPN